MMPVKQFNLVASYTICMYGLKISEEVNDN